MNKKGMAFNILSGIAVCCFLCFVSLLFIVDRTKQEVDVIDVPCYDRYSNEIEGVTCECIVYDYGILNWLIREQCER